MTASARSPGRARRLRSIASKALLCAGLAALSTTCADLARAQEDCGQDADKCARDAFSAGVKAFQDADYELALVHFRKAFEYRPHPAIGLNLALAEAKTGKLLEAIKRFDEVIAHPEASKKLKADAQREREQVVGALAVLTLDLEGNGVTATVDGEPMSGKPPTARLNPGLHELRVMEGDKVLVDRKVNLSRGERLRIAVQRSSEVNLVVQDKPKPKPKPKPESSGLAPVWFYASAGATVALGAATIWSGLDTQRSFDDYEQDLPTLDQDEIDHRVEAGNGKETRTNVLLGITAVAAVGTTALGVWLVDWKGDETPEKGNVAITPGGVLVSGSF